MFKQTVLKYLGYNNISNIDIEIEEKIDLYYNKINEISNFKYIYKEVDINLNSTRSNLDYSGLRPMLSKRQICLQRAMNIGPKYVKYLLLKQRVTWMCL